MLFGTLPVLYFGGLFRKQLTQHEIMDLRIFMLWIKIHKCGTFSIGSNSAMRNGP